MGPFFRQCERIPHGWADRARRVPREISEASHVLTVWFTEAAYLDADGKPRPLPLEGASMSVAALVRSVDPKLDPREVVMYLIRSGAVRRRGARYVPRKRDVLLRGLGGPDYFRTLRVLRNMLGTLEHNVAAEAQGSRSVRVLCRESTLSRESAGTAGQVRKRSRKGDAPSHRPPHASAREDAPAGRADGPRRVRFLCLAGPRPFGESRASFPKTQESRTGQGEVSKP